MAALEEAIEAAVRDAYLRWTEPEPSAPSDGPLIPVDRSPARPEVKGPDAAVSRPRATRVVSWDEIEGFMETATDISQQVQTELNRRGPEAPRRVESEDIQFLPAPRPSAA
jgi:hypothetical protein